MHGRAGAVYPRAMSTLREIAAIYRASKKKRDINWWTEWVCRPPAAALVLALRNTRVTPNQVTLASLVVCALSGAMLLWRDGHAWWLSSGLGDALRHARRLGVPVAMATQAGSTGDEDFPGLAALVSPAGEVARLPDWRAGSLVAEVAADVTVQRSARPSAATPSGWAGG